MRQPWPIVVVFLAGLTACRQTAPAPAANHTLVISIDGLKPEVYTTSAPAKVPALRRLASEGAWANGVAGVMPSSTYPAHTTMITGVSPAVHGIYSNRILDAEDTSGGSWYWYARDIQVPTLLSAARARGLSTAAINWPVSVDAGVDYLFPEFGGVYEHPIWLNLLRALTRPPHLLSSLEAQGTSITWPMDDEDHTALAAGIIRAYRPDLTLVHLFDVDDREHTYGPDAAEALAAIERADAQVQTLLDAVAAAGLTSRTNIVVVSDHGFQHARQALLPNFALKAAGLFGENDEGRIATWDAYFQSNGGSGFVFLRDRGDAALHARVKRVLEDMAADPRNGVAAVIEGEALTALHADPRASFAIDMKDGFAVNQGWNVLRRNVDIGEHGYAPTQAAMHASLIMAGPDVGVRGALGIVRMTQIAPTIAAWFDGALAPDADVRLQPPRPAP